MCQVNTVSPLTLLSSPNPIYNCSLSASLQDPMRSRKGYLQVVGEYYSTHTHTERAQFNLSSSLSLIDAVPPMIVEGMTSNDMVVREGQNVSLMCKARGYPEPYVMWRREDGEEMLIGGEHGKLAVSNIHLASIQQLRLCLNSLSFVPPATINRFIPFQSTSSMANCCTSPK